MGALSVLSEIFKQTSWSSQPKQKITAGRLQIRFEEFLLAQPDPLLLPASDPGFKKAAFDHKAVMRAWSLSTAPFELTNLEFSTCAAVVRFVAERDGGVDPFFAELMETFKVTE